MICALNIIILSVFDSYFSVVHAQFYTVKQAFITVVATSSSAVAKRPRDASCLSVVSFNSTKRRVESTIVSNEGYRFITACS